MHIEQRNSVQQHIIYRDDQFKELQAQWDTLVANGNELNPFSYFAWTNAWWETWGKSQGDTLRIYTYRNERTNELSAIVPLAQVEYGLGAVRPFRVLKPVGRIQNGGMCMEIKPFIVNDNQEDKVIPKLLADITDDVTYAWADLSGIYGDKKIHALWTNNSSHTIEIDNSFLVRKLPNDFESLKSSLSPNTKERLRQGNSKLRKSTYKTEFVITSDPQDITSALDRFFELHTARANFDSAKSHRNYFPTTNHKDFLKHVAKNMPPGSFRIAQLKIDNVVQASRVIFTINNCLYLYSSGFNPDYWNDGIMLTLTTEIMKRAIDEKYAAVNLSVGKDRTKRMWNPDEHFFYKIRIVPQNGKSKVLYRIAEILGQLRNNPI